MKCPECECGLELLDGFKASWPSKIRCKGCGVTLRSEMKMSHSLVCQGLAQLVFWGLFLSMMNLGLVLSFVAAASSAILVVVPFFRWVHFRRLGDE